MPQTGQQLELHDRERLEATGVLQVVGFDDREVILETGLGLLLIRGEGLHITHLDLAAGELAVQGLLNSIEYAEDRSKKLKAKGKNILERLLK